MKTPPPAIELERVTWIEGERRIINNVSWRVMPGERWAVLGLNGSGKTSLMKIVCGYTHATSGRVSVYGMDFGHEDWREVRRTIGLVSSALEEYLYTTESALDIVTGGLYATIGLYDQPSARDRRRAREALGTVGAARLARMPLGTLSQGERQRVSIARALVSRPRLLLMDEPCEGLDILAREGLLAALGAIAAIPGAPAIIYITHRAEEITPAITHALLLKDGAVHSAGPVRRTLTSVNMSAFLGVKAIVRWTGGRPSVTVG